MLIPLLILTPLLFAAMLLAPGPVFGKARNIHVLAMTATSLTFLFSLLTAMQFDWSDTAAVQLAGYAHWIDAFGLSFSYGVDSISLWLVLLTTFLMPLIVLGSVNALQGDQKQRSREFFFWLLILQSAMTGTFVATDLIFFYICFEFTLIPLYFLIGVFGSKQRLLAARVFFLYTFTGSMLTFAGLIYVAWFAATINGQWSFNIAVLTKASASMPAAQQGWVLAALLSGFAVKVPLFPVHTWLPLAHTEAPTAGSVILAGVLLKLGTYGLLRFALPMCPEAVIGFAPWIGALAVAGVLYTALICWVQKDIKKLIAYSSVSHLGFCVLGLFAIQKIPTHHVGQSGAVMYMINHGLSTGALFLCVGMIYERFHTREMRHYGGFARVMPVWSFFLVFFCLASVGLPGLNGFIGEFLTLLGAFNAPDTLGPIYAALAGVGMILGAIYILYMVGKVVFGPICLPPHHGADPHETKFVRDLTGREIAVLTPLAVACLVLGLYPAPMLRSLDAPLAKLLNESAVRVVDETNNHNASPMTIDSPSSVNRPIELTMTNAHD